MKRLIYSKIRNAPFIRGIKDFIKDNLNSREISRKKNLVNQILNKKTVISNPKTILFWSTGGMPDLLKIDATFALALKLRGHNVHVLICDGTYTACVKREISDNFPISSWESKCKSCKQVNTNILLALGLDYSHIGDWVSQEDKKQAKIKANTVNAKIISNVTFDGLNIGSNIESSILRYLGGYDLDDYPQMIDPYVYSGIISSIAAKKCIETIKCDHLFMSHGIYIEWGPALKIAVNKHIPVTGWLSGQIPHRLMLRNISSINSTYVLDIDDATYKKLQSLKFEIKQRDQLISYFKNKYSTNLLNPSVLTHNEKQALCEKYNLNQNKPIWGILAHINWDAVKDCAPMLYSSFNDWIIDTINKVRYIKNIHWVIKIHPAELLYQAPNGVSKVIKANFPVLPDNITIIHAETRIPLSDFVSLVDGAVTVYGTLGLELAVAGKPVIVVGQTHYASKGFTFDAKDKTHYYHLLEDAPNLTKLSNEQTLDAQKYAYSFFINRQIPVPKAFVREGVNLADLDWNNLDQLLPGQDPYLDLICEDIINKGTFELGSELIPSE